ncbi:spike base protein, RCAP_Rcc01079 family [Paenirhodobacter enshiensis]|uniref:Uncharacterized protein n=1 Tax=Paenirhodobacter enshiensis TaxID=1105367 RepID=A0A086XSZ9_9RHOB|nr:hypothetical protein [Paenirhodobacter enshiensis]KFI25149.1 hypothetical protein CG50_06210 [Paenirhodobacter enshiensis]
MYTPHKRQAPGLLSSAIGALPIVPSDTADLSAEIRALTIGTAAGTVAFVSSRDGASYVTGPLPVGTYALFAARILATGTTATGLTGWI